MHIILKTLDFHTEWCVCRHKEEGDVTWAKYSLISLPLKSVLWSRSLASAAARASLKLILTRRNDLKYWNCTSGSNERNKASKLAWKHREGERGGTGVMIKSGKMRAASAPSPPVPLHLLPSALLPLLIYKY